MEALQAALVTGKVRSAVLVNCISLSPCVGAAERGRGGSSSTYTYRPRVHVHLPAASVCETHSDNRQMEGGGRC